MENVIRITTYKDSGKWYSTNESILKREHNKLAGYEFVWFNAKLNDQSVQEYSGIIGGFPSCFHYEVRVIYLDEANQTNFCQYLVC